MNSDTLELNPDSALAKKIDGMRQQYSYHIATNKHSYQWDTITKDGEYHKYEVHHTSLRPTEENLLMMKNDALLYFQSIEYEIDKYAPSGE